MTSPSPTADETPPRWKPGNGRSQPVIFLRKLVLLEDLRPGSVKPPIREVPFRAGLNIVWADPKSAEAASGGVRVAGHSAGKTTLSRARQREMLKSHLPVRMRFSTCFEQVLCFLLGPETSGHIEFDDDGAIVPIAESREPMSSGAIDALTVVALDLAAMLWSVTGHGHHPRLVIHDSPKVADMAPALYAPIFDLAAQAEDDANGTSTFQYILTTTEPPPTKYLGTERIVLTLDASQSEGRLFKRDFKA